MWSSTTSQCLAPLLTRPALNERPGHLQSSTMADGFYDDANKAEHWEVVELHIAGLPLDAGTLRRGV